MMESRRCRQNPLTPTLSRKGRGSGLKSRNFSNAIAMHLSLCYGNLGSIAIERGDKTKAYAYWAESKALYQAVGIPHMVEKIAGRMAEAGCSPS